jgi:hypothetical protein
VKDVAPFFQVQACASCHSLGGLPAALGTSSVPLRFDGSPFDTYVALVAGGTICGAGTPHRLCVDEPPASLLVSKTLQLPGAPQPHPNTNAQFQSWSDPILQVIMEWVAQGAVFDGSFDPDSAGATDAASDGPGASDAATDAGSDACAPSCAGKCAGPDGCGGTCASVCAAPLSCGGGAAPDVCGCTPQCRGKCDGPDGCGGTCSAACPSPLTCGADKPHVCGGHCVTDISPACARKYDGTLWCWGNNATRPTQVDALGNAVVQFASGDQHSCAVKTDGTLWCWGVNSWGQLGYGSGFDGSDYMIYPPAQVSALGGKATEVQAGSQHTCAREKDGSMWCWGFNASGQLGSSVDSGVQPAQVPGIAIAHIADMSTSDQATYAIRTDGSLAYFSDSFSYDLSNLVNSVMQASAGRYHACAVETDGTLWCWGANDQGQLGVGLDDGSTETDTPIQVTSLGSSVAQVSAGGESTCAVKADGSAWCWGGQVDLGNSGDPPAPPSQVTAFGANVAKVAAGESTACALKRDGTVWCWDTNGQPGNTVTPTQLAIACGDTVAPTGSQISMLTAPSCGTISLSWPQGSDDVTAPGDLVYDVCYSDTAGQCAGGGASAVHRLVESTSTMISGLAPGTRYYVLVRAIDESGNVAAPGAEMSVTTPSGAGMKPSPPLAAATRMIGAGSSINVSWDEVSTECLPSSALNYEYCLGGSSCSSWTPVSPTSGNAFTATGQLVCSAVTIAVRALNGGVASDPAVITVAKGTCYGDVQFIFTGCASTCHTGPTSSQLSSNTSKQWTTMLSSCGSAFASPGDPYDSYLYQVLSSSYPTFAPASCIRTPMTAGLSATVLGNDTELVRQWIVDGANDSGQ